MEMRGREEEEESYKIIIYLVDKLVWVSERKSGNNWVTDIEHC